MKERFRIIWQMSFKENKILNFKENKIINMWLSDVANYYRLLINKKVQTSYKERKFKLWLKLKRN